MSGLSPIAQELLVLGVLVFCYIGTLAIAFRPPEPPPVTQLPPPVPASKMRCSGVV